jgi:hypothetical protein
LCFFDIVTINHGPRRERERERESCWVFSLSGGREGGRERWNTEEEREKELETRKGKFGKVRGNENEEFRIYHGLCDGDWVRGVLDDGIATSGRRRKIE